MKNTRQELSSTALILAALADVGPHALYAGALYAGALAAVGERRPRKRIRSVVETGDGRGIG